MQVLSGELNVKHRILPVKVEDTLQFMLFVVNYKNRKINYEKSYLTKRDQNYNLRGHQYYFGTKTT